MPIEFDILKNHGLTCIRMVGTVNLSEFLKHLLDYQEHTSYRLGLNEFIDLSGWTDTDMGYTEMRQLRDAECTLYPAGQAKTRCSIFAPTGFQYGMARIYASLADVTGDLHCQVFDDRQEALAYLDLGNLTLPDGSTKGTTRRLGTGIVQNAVS